MDWKVTADGKEVATFACTDEGCNAKVTKEGKKLLKECKKNGFCGCC